MAEEEAKPEATPKPAAKPEAAPPPAPKAPPTMAATPWEGDLPREVKDQFGDQILEASSYLGQDFFLVQSGAVIPLLEFLKLDADFDYLVDITAVHYPSRDKQFELFYILYSFARNTRVRIKTRIAETESPQTAVGVHLTANWLEREVFDMFGIRFAGHPNMQRLLLPEDWQGHPLRKDYGIIQMDNQWVKENLGIESGQ